MAFIAMMLSYSGYSQHCYRVYITMYADFSYYDFHGRNESTVRNTLTQYFNKAAQIYKDQLDVQLVLNNIVVYKNASTDPFNRNGSIAGVQFLNSDVPTTYGGSVQTHGGTTGMTYDFSIIFTAQLITFNSTWPFGLTLGGSLFTTHGASLVTAKFFQPPLDPRNNPSDQGQVISRTSSEVEATFLHELGHGLGATEDVCRPNSIMCQGNSQTPGVFSQTSKNQINALLVPRHRDNIFGSGNAEPFASRQGTTTFSTPDMFQTSGDMTVRGVTLVASASSADVRLKAGTALRLTGTCELRASNGGKIGLISESRLQSYCNTPSASAARFASAEEEPEELSLSYGDSEQQEDVRIYPNPANDMIMIEYLLREPSFVKIYISDVTGRRRADLVNQERAEAGSHAESADISSLSGGIYLINVETNNGRKVLRLIKN